MDAIGIDFAALLPAFMRAQEDDAAMADALSPVLRARALQLASLGIADFLCDADAPLTNAQASTLLDSLAAYMRLEWWRADWDAATKRGMIAQAEKLRQLSESKWALETILRVYFGDPALTVEEWWEYGGAPYCFRVLTSNPDAQAALRFKNVVELIKRQSQQWEGLWAGFSCRGVIYRGALGTDDTRLTGEAILYRYLPAGTTVDGADGFAALSSILQEANPGQDVTDILDDCFDYGTYTVTADLPLTFQEYGLPDWQAIPSTHAAGARLDAAMAEHWSDVGADVDAPSRAYQWPPSGGGSADLLTGLAHFWSGGAASSVLDLSDAVDGGWALTNAADWTGNAAAAAEGIFGGAFGIGSASKYAYSTSKNFLASDCSIAFWIKPLSTPTGGARFARIPAVKAVGHTGWSGTPLDIIAPTPSSWYRLGLQCVPGSDPAVTVEADAPSSFAVGSWNLLVLTWDAAAGIATLWANGEKIIEASETFIANNNTLAFGIAGASGGNGVAGTYDEVAVWTRVLGQAEVQALWNGGAGLPFEDWT